VPAIRVIGLSVRIGETVILDEVSFSLDSGGFLAVIGPNGAGKSTLVRCLDGLVASVSGRVELNGREVCRLGRRALAREVSYVPQADDRGLDYTVRAFVEMGRYPHVRGWASLGAEDHEAVRSALDSTETSHLQDRSLASLSGGERQRVHIAAALAQGGDVLLLDEPTSFLDYRHQVQLGELLHRLCSERGLCIVAVTHDLNSSVAEADAVLALKQGRVVFFGPPSGLFADRILAGIYDTTFQLVDVAGRATPLVLPVVERR